MIWNIRKQKTTNQNKKKKKESKNKQGWYKQPLGQLQAFQQSHAGGARRRERTTNWKSI